MSLFVDSVLSTAWTPSNLEKGTADGQMLFWDDTNTKWLHTETNELIWDDTNKRLFLPKSNTATSGTQYPSRDLALESSAWETGVGAAEVAKTITLRNIAGSGPAGVAPYRLAVMDITPTEYFAFSFSDGSAPAVLSFQLKSSTEIRFYDNGNYVGFKAPALAADQIWTLPTADGNAGEYLQTDGAGVLSFSAVTITHDILDGSTHTDSVADAVTRGSLIYGNATPKWDELVLGTDRQHLESDGTDISWVTNLSFLDNAKIVLGTGNDGELYVDANNDLIISNVTQDVDVIFKVNKGGTTATLLTLDASTGRVGIAAATAPEAEFHVIKAGETPVSPAAVPACLFQTDGQYAAEFITTNASYSGFILRNTTATGAPFVQWYNSNSGDLYTIVLDTGGNMEFRNGNAAQTEVLTLTDINTIVVRGNTSFLTNDITAVGAITASGMIKTTFSPSSQGDAGFQHHHNFGAADGDHIVLRSNVSAGKLRSIQWWDGNATNYIGGLGIEYTSPTVNFHFHSQYNSAYKDEATKTLSIMGNGRIGVNNVTSPSATGHFDQAATGGAIPVLYLDQADISEEMIEFNTTIGVGNAIEAVGAKTLTTTHFIKITIPGGLTRYIPCGTIA